MATPDTIYRNLQEAVKERRTEDGERAAVARVLAHYGFTGEPSVHQTTGMDANGNAVGVARLYLYRGTPAGDFVLIAGPSIEGRITRPDRIGLEGKSGRVFAEAPKASRSVLKATQQAVKSAVGRAAKKGQKKEKKVSPKVPKAPRAAKLPHVTFIDILDTEGPILPTGTLPLGLSSLAAADQVVRILATTAPAPRAYQKLFAYLVTSEGGPSGDVRIDVTQDMARQAQPFTDYLKAMKLPISFARGTVSEKDQAAIAKFAAAFKRASTTLYEIPHGGYTPRRPTRSTAIPQEGQWVPPGGLPAVEPSDAQRMAMLKELLRQALAEG